MNAIDIAKGLSFWSGKVDPQPVKQGITNQNFIVTDGGKKYFVRIGLDIPVHGIMRFNEAASAKAAALCDLSPALLHVEPGALIFEYLPAKTLDPEAVRHSENLGRVVDLVRRCHKEMTQHIRGPLLAFWVFHILRDYAASLKEAGSSYKTELSELMSAAIEIERAIPKIELVYAHNDLLAANLMDDGKRLWIIDWDYGGWNSPLFDLANLASNNELPVVSERFILERYFERPIDDMLWREYSAMKCASLLRETLWSMVSEIHSVLDFDYAAYTSENRVRFDRAMSEFRAL